MELTTVIIVTAEFSHSNDGIVVDHYEPGEHLVSERCAEVATKQLKTATQSKKTAEAFLEEQASQSNPEKTTAKIAKSKAE